MIFSYHPLPFMLGVVKVENYGRIYYFRISSKKRKKDNIVSKLLNPVFLTDFLRPILIAEIWEGYLEHAKSRTKAHAASLLCLFSVLLYNTMLERGLQEGCESSRQIPWLLSHTVQVPCILSNRTVIIFLVLQDCLNFFLHALYAITKFLSSCWKTMKLQ